MSINLSATTPAAPAGKVLATPQADGLGNISIAVPSSSSPSGAAGGDLSGTYPNPTVAKVNGGSVPTSKTIVGTDGSGKIVDATSVTLSNNTSGTAANLSGTPALPNGTTATTQSPGDSSANIATDAFVASSFAATANPLYHGNFFQQISGLTIAQVIAPTKVSGTGDGVGINYTVPVGMRAIAEIYCIQGDGSDTLSPEVNISGTYYVLGSIGVSVNTIPQVLFSPWPSQIGQNMVFEAGDIISVNSSGGTGYIYGTIYTFPNTVPYKWARYITSAATSIGSLNSIYTVPVGKHAQVLGSSSAAPATPQAIVMCESTTGNVRSWLYRVPSGVTPNGVHLLNSPGGPLNIQSGPTAVIAAISTGALAAGDCIQFLPLGINPLNMTSVANASAGSTVYTGTFTNGAANAYAGCSFYIIGFVNPANNGLFTCTASTATTLTLNNASGVAETRISVAGQTSHLLSAAAAGTGVYTGIFLNGASGGGLKNYKVTISGFANAANNGTFIVTSSTATSITTNNASSVAETHAGLCTLINPSTGFIVAFALQEF